MNCNKRQRIHPFLKVKKIMWRRVFRMLVVAVLAAIISLVVIVLAISELYPDWELPNYQTIQMKKTAKKVVGNFAQGDIDRFLQGSLNRTGESYAMNGALYAQVRKNIEEVYREYLGGDYTIEMSYGSSMSGGGTDLYHFEIESGSAYGTIHFENGIDMRIFLEFTDPKCYSIESVDVTGLQEITDILNNQIWYYESVIEGRNITDQFLTDIMLDLNGSDEAERKKLCKTYVSGHFTTECMSEWGEEGKEAAGYKSDLVNKMSRLHKKIQTQRFFMTKTGVNQEEKKETVTLTWCFRDNRGKEGALVKDFYYGPFGYEPVNDKETIYGTQLEKGLKKQLEQVFDCES